MQVFDAYDRCATVGGKGLIAVGIVKGLPGKGGDGGRMECKAQSQTVDAVLVQIGASLDPEVPNGVLHDLVKEFAACVDEQFFIRGEDGVFHLGDECSPSFLEDVSRERALRRLLAVVGCE